MNFDPNKDYYGILGITPSAEMAVIKAAYKALAGIYHPDRNQANDAVSKMQAINEAWEILSDPSTREKYDEAIGNKKPESDAFDETDQSEDEEDAIKDYFEKDWNFARSYYPDLEIYAERLRKMGSRYEIAYKAQIVSGKDFSRGKEIAEIFEQGYLDTYFSTNSEIQEIATKLIWSKETRDQEILKELSIAVKTLGASDPDVIIRKFKHLKTKESIRAYATNSHTFLGALYRQYRVNKTWQKKSQYISVFLIIALLFIIAKKPQDQDSSIDVEVSADRYESDVEVSVDRYELDLGETLFYTIRIFKLRQGLQLDLTVLTENFNVLGTRTSSQIATVNGTVESWTDYIVTLLPIKKGELEIPSLNISGTRTKSITVSVEN